MDPSGKVVVDESAVFVGRLDADPLDELAWIEVRIKHGTDFHEVREQMLVDAEHFKLKQPYTLIDVGPPLDGEMGGVVLFNLWDGTMKPNVCWRRWSYRLTGRA